MILVDTSVWVQHLRLGDPELARLLDRASVLGHPFVTGELALGSIPRRAELLGLLERLPSASVARHSEVMQLIDNEGLAGSGIGYVDACLLASARITPDALFWTRDRRLNAVALRVGVAFPI